jgi:hypothetical protein
MVSAAIWLHSSVDRRQLVTDKVPVIALVQSNHRVFSRGPKTGTFPAPSIILKRIVLERSPMYASGLHTYSF